MNLGTGSTNSRLCVFGCAFKKRRLMRNLRNAFAGTLHWDRGRPARIALIAELDSRVLGPRLGTAGVPAAQLLFLSAANERRFAVSKTLHATLLVIASLDSSANRAGTSHYHFVVPL